MTFRLAPLPSKDQWADEGELSARALETTGRFRILRRLDSDMLKPEAMADVGRGQRLAIVLDTETTGVDHRIDKVIELAMLAVTYDQAGPHDVVATFEGLEDPGTMLTPEIRRLTGLKDDDLHGHRINRDAIEGFLRQASVVVAHNARFDRPFAETVHPLFAKLPWACSLHEVDWTAGGTGGHRLEDLLRRRGLFHDGHRALSDCIALLAVLRAGVSTDRPPAFLEMLGSARRTTVEVRAGGAPYGTRPVLKNRGYRWLPDVHGQNAWTVSVPEEDLEAELEFLRLLLPSNAVVPVRRLTAFERYR